MRPLIITSLLLSCMLTATAGEGEKVDVTTLPEAVKATVTKEAPAATQVMKTPGKDGKTVYRVKHKDADGKPVIVTIGEDGTVLSKQGPKEKKEK